MRVVLDTNVIVSATLIRGGNEDRTLRAWGRGRFDIGADYVVTGDRDLLDLGRYDDVRIVTPGAFLKLLRRDQRRNT